MGNKFALLKWKKSNDVAQIRVARSPGRGEEAQTVVYTGNADFYKDAGIDNGKKYDYSVTALDEASNSVEQKATAVPLPALYNPAAGARVRGKLVFEWLPVQARRTTTSRSGSASGRSSPPGRACRGSSCRSAGSSAASATRSNGEDVSLVRLAGTRPQDRPGATAA